jgi:hypothetical protein
LATSGDTINIGEGTFNETVEVYKPGLSFVGAGKDKTIVKGFSNNSYTKTSCVFTLGSPVVSVPSGTSDMFVGQPIESSDTKLGNACYIIAKDASTVTVSQNAAASGTASLIHRLTEGTIMTRASNLSFSAMKVEGFDAHDANEKSAFFFRNTFASWKSTTGGSMTPSTNITVSDCEIMADGEYAILTDAIGTVGNITVTGCIISGKTFSGNVAPVSASTVRQAVVFQSANLPITFTNNKVDVIVGGIRADSTLNHNQAVTIDANSSVVTGNQIRARAINSSGEYVTQLNGLALRMRGYSPTVSNNTNKTLEGQTNYGFLILPSWAASKAFLANQYAFKSNKIWKCIQDHTSATANAPDIAGGAAYWQDVTAQADIQSQLASAGQAYYQLNSGSNQSVTVLLSSSSQVSSGDPVKAKMGASFVLAISSVSADPVFSSQSNWSMVSYIFKKVGSSARLVSSFRDFALEKSMKLRSGMVAGDQFQIHKIIIAKFESDGSRTLKVIKRSQIEDPSQYDFQLK